MKFTAAPLKGLYVVEPKVFADARGFFFESYNKRVFEEGGIPELFVQDNISRSSKGTVRGLHYQLPPHGQGKLVRAISGEIFDVALDIRKGSPSFGQWFGCLLSSENKRALYVPPGFAHGFCVVSETAEVAYKCTALYAPHAERGVLWNDPAVGIRWPVDPGAALVSEKDQKHPPLSQAEITSFF